MPASIAAFMKEALEEGKFDDSYVNRIDERVEEMNASQLQGIYNHLVRTAKESKSDIWRNANKKIISHVEGRMKEKVHEVEMERKEKEGIIEQIDMKEKLKIMRKIQEENELKAIQRLARDTATKFVLEDEKRRKRKEQKDIMVSEADLEEKRDRQLQYLAIGYILISITIVIIFTSTSMNNTLGKSINVIIICSYFGIATILVIYLAYKKIKDAKIIPLVVTEEDIENKIDEMEEEIKNKRLQELEEIEKKHKEAEKKEKELRKKRKAEANKKAEYEKNLMSEIAQEQARAAEELLISSTEMGENS